MNFEQAKETVRIVLESEVAENTLHLMWINAKLNALKLIESQSDLASFELIKYSTSTVLFNEHIVVSSMIRKLMKI